MIVGCDENDPELVEFRKEFDSLRKQRNERIEFLNRQAADLEKFSKNIHKSFWKKVETFLADNGRFPSWYDADKFNIGYNEKTKVYFIDQLQSEKELPTGLKKFLKGIGVSIDSED